MATSTLTRGEVTCRGSREAQSVALAGHDERLAARQPGERRDVVQPQPLDP